MMEFIYDRTQADVERIKELNKKYIDNTITDEERQEWFEDSKGVLNVSDLNRIESNMETLSDILEISIETKNWIIGDIPRVSDYKRILDNLQAIREAWYTFPPTPDNPLQPLNTYKKWNDIEKILHDIDYTYTRHIKSFYYCDTEIYAGEGIGIL